MHCLTLSAPFGFTSASYIPNASIAAGNLASVIFESEPMKMPPHLRETRTVPIPEVQPTKSDFKAFAAYETPLFADSLVAGDSEALDISGPPRSSLHDFEFTQLMVRTPLDVSCPKIRYILGSMTAVWEGVVRVSTLVFLMRSVPIDELSSRPLTHLRDHQQPTGYRSFPFS
jgi:hypothetical protein